MLRSIVAGAVAAAAGELALNVVSYGDMLVRARPPSEMPGKVAKRLSDTLGLEFVQPGEAPGKAVNRQEAAGALLGYGMAVSTTVVYALLRRAGVRLPVPLGGLVLGASAMAISDTTAVALGVTDPRAWGAAGWLSDIFPHAAFGIVAAATLEFTD
jgi:hypothetical protein